MNLVGAHVVLEVFQKTQKIEAEGGMMIKNGARRRTPGGVFLHLLREINDDPRVDARKVKQFFAQSQRNDFHQEHNKFSRGNNQQHKDRRFKTDSNRHPYKKSYGSYQRSKFSSGEGPKIEDSFENELKALRKLSEKVKNKREQEKQNPEQLVEQPVDMEDYDQRRNSLDAGQKIDDEEIKPLPDILTCISKQMSSNIHERSHSEHNNLEDNTLRRTDSSSSSPSGQVVSQHDLLASCQPSTSSAIGATRPIHSSQSSQLDFEPDEPEAPPNSVERVERTVNTYEDDLLADFNTEDIELF